MENTIETLLESLNDYTIQSEQVLEEGSNSIDRILQLQSRLSGSANCLGFKLSDNDKLLIEKAKKINPTFDHRVLTYKNIHHEVKYDIHAECNVDFVIAAIENHMQHPEEDFNPKLINEEAIYKTFKRITRSPYTARKMDLNEFKDQYKSHVFGTYKKELVIPKPLVIAKLFERSPFIINYINNRLIFEHINSLKKYYKEIEEKFNKLAKSNPEITVSLNGYLACLDTAIRNTLIMYQTIRSTFYELNTEYRYVFGEIIHIDRELNSGSMSESSVNYYNSLFTNINTLCESINSDSNSETLNESTLTDNPSKLSDTSKSLLDSFIKELEIDISKRESNKVDIMSLINKSGIISKISNDDLQRINSMQRIYPNTINNIDMSKFISQLNTKIDFCKNQFNELINNTEQLNRTSKYTILNELLHDTSFWEEVPEDRMNNSVGFLSDSIKGKLIGKPITIEISNLDYTFENIVNIPSYLSQINDHIINYDNMLIELITNIKNTNNSQIELIITKIIRAYIAYSSIISCIYYNLTKLENNAIKLVQNLIDEINL